jgi:hypothetical protein
MRKVEIVARFKKSKTPSELNEEREQEKLDKLIYGDDYVSPTSKDPKHLYEYERISIDVEDIRVINPVDKNHTCLRTYSGDIWTIRADYDDFKEFYQEITHTEIIEFPEHKYLTEE